MTIASDVYLELTRAGLAPDLPFVAADDKWREAINRGVGDADELVRIAKQLVGENFVLEGLLNDANAQAAEWKRKYEAATAKAKKPVNA